MKTLFDETSIGTMKLKNRLVRAAAGDRHGRNGHITEKDFEVYEELAKGGAGTIITGFTYIHKSDTPLSPGMMGIYEDSFIPEYKKLTDIVHSHEANIIMQLVYCGSYTRKLEEGRKALAPSAVENLHSKIMPEEMSKEEIKLIQKAFADAAVRAKKAGFDGVQLHGAHGFLLNQFITPYYNRRGDEYGGFIENRARMLLETYSLVREAVGDDYPVLVKLNCTDGIEQGVSFDDFRYVSKELANLGINGIEVSGAWMQYKPKEEFYFKEYAEKIAEENDVPVILVGGNRNFDSMTSLLNKTAIEYFSMCRPLISEPNLVNRWKSGDLSKTRCISCNGCLGSGHCVLKD